MTTALASTPGTIAVAGIGANAVTELEPTTLAFETRRFKRASAHCSPDTERCATLDITYPLATKGDEKVLRTINDSILRGLLASIGSANPDQRPMPTLSQAADLFLAEYDQFAGQVEAAVGWSVVTSVQLIFENVKLAVFALATSSYTGGAHPNSYKEMFNFDKLTGDMLEYRDFISNITALKRIAEQEFKLARGLLLDANLFQEGFFEGQTFRLAQNFAITEEGLRLVYNPYEAAPYALGPTDFVIPWIKLGNIFRKTILG